MSGGCILAAPLGLMSIGLMAILVRGLGLLMLGVASTAGQLLGSVLIDVLIPSLGNSVYLVTIIGTLFALVGNCYHYSGIQNLENNEENGGIIMKDYLQTVTGPVAREDMGLTLPHEHLFNDLSSVVDAPCYPFHNGLLIKSHGRNQWALNTILIAALIIWTANLLKM